MAAPVIVGTATIYASAVSGNTVVLDRGTALADGDFALAFLRTNGSTSPTDFALSGWVRRGYPFVPNDASGRVFGVYSHPVPTASSEPATSTFAKSVSDARRVGAMVIVRGVDLTNPIAGNSTGWDATPSPRIQLNSFAVDTADPTLLVYAWANEITSPTATAPTIVPGTELALVPSSAGTGATRTTIWVGWEQISATSTGHKNLTWAGTPAGPAATGVVLRGLNVVTTSGTVTAAAGVSGTVAVEVARAATVTAGGTLTGSATSEVSRDATVAAAASLTGTVGAVSITRTALLTAAAAVAGAAVADVTVAAVVAVSVSVSSVVVLQVERSAVVAVTVSVSGAVKGPPIPDVRVLDEVAFVHSLTGIPVSHTLEDA